MYYFLVICYQENLILSRIEDQMPAGLKPFSQKHSVLFSNYSTVYFSMSIAAGNYHPTPGNAGSSYYDLECVNQNRVELNKKEYCEDLSVFINVFEDILNKIRFSFSHYLIAQSPSSSIKIYTRCLKSL